MPSIKKRGKSFCIMVSMNYDMASKQIRKTTTFTLSDGVIEGNTSFENEEQVSYACSSY